MKKLILVVTLLLSTVLVAQDASINAPVQPPAEAKYVAKKIDITASVVIITLGVQSSGSADLRAMNVVIPSAANPTATVTGFFTALDTARANETGGILRRMNFRVLGYLFDTGYLPGTTVNP